MIPSEVQALPAASLYALLLLIFAIAAVALFLWLRQRFGPPAPAGAPPALTGRDAIRVLISDRRASGSASGRSDASFTVYLPDDDGTYLVPLLDDDGMPGAPIRVPARSVYIGRDAGRAQIVFADPSVSRIHARLVEEGEGIFVLHDEGSASGTFVNDERLDLRPRRLKPGDLLEFGRQRVIFESIDPIQLD
jgi:hypothetical protein